MKKNKTMQLKYMFVTESLMLMTLKVIWPESALWGIQKATDTQSVAIHNIRL